MNSWKGGAEERKQPESGLPLIVCFEKKGEEEGEESATTVRTFDESRYETIVICENCCETRKTQWKAMVIRDVVRLIRIVSFKYIYLVSFVHNMQPSPMNVVTLSNA